MPTYKNARVLADSLATTHKDLEKIFSGFELDPSFQLGIQKIQTFYSQSFAKTTWKCTGKAVIKEYQDLVAAVKAVSLGTKTAGEALTLIKNTTNSRQIGVVLGNVLNLAGLLFWATAATLSYLAAVTFGIAVFAANPFPGTVVLMAFTALAITSVVKMISNLEQYKSFDPVNIESANEENLVHFFSHPRTKVPNPSEPDICPQRTQPEVSI